MKKIFTVLAMLCMVVGAMGNDALVSYTGKTYGIDYVLFEGQIAGTNPDQARYGEKFRVISPTRAGYTFAGWSVTRNLNTESAKWGVSEPDVAIDSTATRCGKGEPSVYFINLAGSESGRVTLTATWQVSETSSIDATLLYAIGDIVPRSSLTPSKMTLKAGDKVDLSRVTKTGYTIDHTQWTYRLNSHFADGTIVARGAYSFVPSNSPTTGLPDGSPVPPGLLVGDLVAVCSPNEYSVAYDLNGGTMGTPAPSSATYDASFTVGAPSREGYTFAGWRVTSNLSMPTARWGTGPETNDVGSMSTKCGAGAPSAWFLNLTTATGATVRLSAEWAANDYVVTYNANGGALDVTTNTVTYGAVYGTLPTPTRIGYDFVGWFTAVTNGVRVGEGSTVSVAAAHMLYAHWTEASYDVAFDANGGSVATPSKRVTYKSAYGTLPVPTRDGYAFEGWWTLRENGLEVTGDLECSCPSNQTLYAHWMVRNYGVNFDANGGCTTRPTLQCTYDSAYGELPAPTRAGYTFAGWFTAAEGGERVSESSAMTFASEHTLYAHWTTNTYSVTFDANGGRSTETLREVYDAPYVFPENPTRVGYAFAGWWTKTSGGEPVTTNCLVDVVSNVSVYAHWAPNQYRVTFDANGGSVATTSGNVAFGAPYGILPVPERTGHVFSGWGTTLSGGLVTETNRVSEAADHTLYAHWTAQTSTVTFDANGGSVSSSSGDVSFGSVYGSLPTPSRAGYTFDGWFTTPSGGTRVESSTTMSSTTEQTLYARWTPMTKVVALDANGGVEPSPSAVAVTNGFPYGELPVPVREGYVFQGWYTSGNGGEVVTADTQAEVVSTSTPQTLFAHWVAEAYGVRLDANGGTVSPWAVGVTNAMTYGAMPVPTRAGYAFAGWWTSAEGGTEIKSSTRVTASSARTLYAHWSTGSCTVTFDSNGGDAVSPATQDVLAVYGRLPVATRPGYEFAGWWTSETGGSQIKSSTTVTATGNQTLYAHWSPRTYMVSLDAAGGRVTPATMEVEYASRYGWLPTPSKPGYAFSGWYTAAEGGTKVEASTGVVTASDHALYARWSANAYQVAFNLNGGDGAEMPRQNFRYDEPQALASNQYTRVGYAFIGWSVKSADAPVAYADGAVASNLTTVANGTVVLYANWRKEQYTVVFHGSEGRDEAGHEETVQDLQQDITARLNDNPFTRDGWIFQGWATNETQATSGAWTFENGAEVTNLAPNGAVCDLFAVWTGCTYRVTFMSEEGLLGDPDAHAEYVTNWDTTGTVVLSITTNYPGFGSSVEMEQTVGSTWRWPQVIQTNESSRLVFDDVWTNETATIAKNDLTITPPESKGLTNLVAVWIESSALAVALDWRTAKFETDGYRGGTGWTVDTTEKSANDLSGSSLKAFLPMSSEFSTSRIRTTVTGPGILKFDWKVTGQAWENGLGHILTFSPDGKDGAGGFVETGRVSPVELYCGDVVGWQTVVWTNSLEGAVQLWWLFDGEGTTVPGEAWLDHVQWIPEGSEEPVPEPVNVYAGLSGTFRGVEAATNEAAAYSAFLVNGYSYTRMMAEDYSVLSYDAFREKFGDALHPAGAIAFKDSGCYDITDDATRATNSTLVALVYEERKIQFVDGLLTTNAPGSVENGTNTFALVFDETASSPVGTFGGWRSFYQAPAPVVVVTNTVTVPAVAHATAFYTWGDGVVTNAVENGAFGVPEGTTDVRVILLADDGFEFASGGTVFVYEIPEAGTSDVEISLEDLPTTSGIVYVARIGATGYRTLQAAIDAAGTRATTVELTTNVAECVAVAGGQDVTLDLAGFTVDADGRGRVVRTAGRFTLTNSTERLGALVNGWSAEEGGGVYVESGATFVLSGGAIANCRAVRGGGVAGAATVRIRGGVIDGCTSVNGDSDALALSAGSSEITGGTVNGSVFAEGGRLQIMGGFFGGAVDGLEGRVEITGGGFAERVRDGLLGTGLQCVAREDETYPWTVAEIAATHMVRVPLVAHCEVKWTSADGAVVNDVAAGTNVFEVAHGTPDVKVFYVSEAGYEPVSGEIALEGPVTADVVIPAALAPEPPALRRLTVTVPSLEHCTAYWTRGEGSATNRIAGGAFGVLYGTSDVEVLLVAEAGYEPAVRSVWRGSVTDDVTIPPALVQPAPSLVALTVTVPSVENMKAYWTSGDGSVTNEVVGGVFQVPYGTENVRVVYGMVDEAWGIEETHAEIVFGGALTTDREVSGAQVPAAPATRRMTVRVPVVENAVACWTSGDGSTTNLVEDGVFAVAYGTENVTVVYVADEGYEFSSVDGGRVELGTVRADAAIPEDQIPEAPVRRTWTIAVDSVEHYTAYWTSGDGSVTNRVEDGAVEAPYDLDVRVVYVADEGYAPEIVDDGVPAVPTRLEVTIGVPEVAHYAAYWTSGDGSVTNRVEDGAFALPYGTAGVRVLYVADEGYEPPRCEIRFADMVVESAEIPAELIPSVPTLKPEPEDDPDPPPPGPDPDPGPGPGPEPVDRVTVTVPPSQGYTAYWTSGDGSVTNVVSNGAFTVPAGTENVKVLYVADAGSAPVVVVPMGTVTGDVEVPPEKVPVKPTPTVKGPSLAYDADAGLAVTCVERKVKGTYSGWLEDGAGRVVATATYTLAKPSTSKKSLGLVKVTAKIANALTKKTVSLKGEGYPAEDGSLTVELFKGKASYGAVTFQGDCLVGEIALDGVDYSAMGGRVAEKKLDGAGKYAALARYVGAWTAVFSPQMDDMAVAAVKIAAGGKASVAIYLADGTYLSTKGQLIVGKEGWVALPIAVAKKVKGRMLTFATVLWLSPDPKANVWTATGDGHEVKSLAHATLTTAQVKQLATSLAVSDSTLQQVEVEKAKLALTKSNGLVKGSFKIGRKTVKVFAVVQGDGVIGFGVLKGSDPFYVTAE